MLTAYLILSIQNSNSNCVHNRRNYHIAGRGTNANGKAEGGGSAVRGGGDGQDGASDQVIYT